MQREVIEESLGYRFNDVSWLEQALTHPSADQKRSTNLHYERLEFLGDAVLELVVSRELFTRFPKADEGTLTKMRAGIVSRRHLGELCAELGWCEQLRLSPQLEKSGGRNILSVRANTFESVIGAVMMDSQYNAARRVALKLLQGSLDAAEKLVAVNFKGELLELLQAVNNEAPTYSTEPVSPEAAGTGPFIARVHWQGRVLGQAQGASKREAEMSAAAAALQAYRQQH